MKRSYHRLIVFGCYAAVLALILHAEPVQAVSCPVPVLARLPHTNFTWIISLPIDGAKLEQQLAAISNQLFRLETNMCRPDASMLMTGIDRTEKRTELAYQSLYAMLNGVSDATRDLADGKTALADEITDLTCAVKWLGLGFIAIAVILLFRNTGLLHFSRLTSAHTSGEKLLVNNCSAPAPSEGQVSVVYAKKHASPMSSMPEIVPLPCELSDPNASFNLLVDEALREGILAPARLDEKYAAVESTAGHIRIENQDYYLGFQMGNYTVLLISDGCGGTDYGAYAANMAVREAATYLLHHYASIHDSAELSRKALFHAADAMEKHAAVAEPSLQNGFRTTLIIILADSQRYAFAYAGDGGGVVVRKSGSVEKFLFPQKADEDHPNVLATSLGPYLDGEPASGSLPRYDGDLLLTGTDGIWDYVGPNFPLAVAQSLAKAGGNALLATSRIVRDLADFTDATGHVCTDNLTLGMISDPVRAAMPPKGSTTVSKST